MPRLKQIEVVQQTGGLVAGGGIAIIGLDEGGTLLWRGILSRTPEGETVTWEQINERPR